LFTKTTSCVVLISAAFLSLHATPSAAETPENHFANPSFEHGREAWRVDKGGNTVAQFTVDDTDAVADRHSALVTIADVASWGSQFGQTVESAAVGKTYTFAVFAKAIQAPLAVDLQIEQSAKPWSRVAKSKRFTLAEDQWEELHVTFTVETSCPEGWFAYVSCTQPNAQYRADMFRLYEGPYVPYREVVREEGPTAQVLLFDTGTTSPGPLSGGSLSTRTNWRLLPEEKTDHAFQGDAVILNSRLAVVLRRDGHGAEVYRRSAQGAALQAVLAPVSRAGEAKLTSLAIDENTAGEVALVATLTAAGGQPLRLLYGLSPGQPFVRTEARSGVADLRIEAPCRFLVLPDFFADDIVINACEIPVDVCELPSENFLLHMLPHREAIVMAVWSSREQDARIALSGDKAERTIESSEIRYGPEGETWVAVLGGFDIWHCREVAREDAGKILPLRWQAPFAAQWRVDWRRDDHLADSWEMISEQPGGDFVKHGWFSSPTAIPSNRRRWTTVLGSFQYPCWVDRDGRGYLQPFAGTRTPGFQGPALVYPINRVRQTPLEEFTAVDVVRATLGVGPCEYILDVEAQGTSRKGRATCATRDALRAIYSTKQQKQKRAEIETLLDDVVIFVKHIRARIEDYVAFGHELLVYLDEQEEEHLELAGFLDEMKELTRAIDAGVARRKSRIKTPQYVIDLTEEFRRELLDDEGDDAFGRCKAITESIVVVGGNQDELVGECRMAVKVLRQRAGLAMAVDPRTAEIAREIRRRTQRILRKPTSYEAPRH